MKLIKKHGRIEARKLEAGQKGQDEMITPKKEVIPTLKKAWSLGLRARRVDHDPPS
jgi:hypothetical protein